MHPSEPAETFRQGEEDCVDRNSTRSRTKAIHDRAEVQETPFGPHRFLPGRWADDGGAAGIPGRLDGSQGRSGYGPGKVQQDLCRDPQDTSRWPVALPRMTGASYRTEHENTQSGSRPSRRSAALTDAVSTAASRTRPSRDGSLRQEGPGRTPRRRRRLPCLSRRLRALSPSAVTPGTRTCGRDAMWKCRRGVASADCQRGWLAGPATLLTIDAA